MASASTCFAILALAVTAAVMLATAASAKVIVRERTHEEETLVLNNFCDVQALTVEDAFVGDFRLRAVPHGRDRLAYFIEKDLRVTDNGDGTLTILVLSTGNGVVYGKDGKAIARNPGQVRFEILIDHNARSRVRARSWR